MFSIHKKLIHVMCGMCFMFPAYSAKSAKEKPSAVSKKDDTSFEQGEGAFWALRKYDSFIGAGKKLKDTFRNLIQDIKAYNIFIPETQSSGLSSKNNGESYRFKMSFSMDDVEDLRYLFNKSMNKATGLSKNLVSMRESLEKFHDETNSLLSALKLLAPKYPGVGMSENDTNAEQESNSELNYIKQTNDIFEMTTRLPGNISLEVRLVGGQVRDLKPHLDDNTVCVFSIDAQGVYESVPFTRNTRKKSYLKDGESYLWFGTKHGIFSPEVYRELRTLGVEKADITPLAHGVEGRAYEGLENMPISLLLVVKQSENNKGYIVLPKAIENFQAFLTPKNDTVKKMQRADV